MLIMIGMLKRRIPGIAKYEVLKYLQMGVIDVDHVVDEDMLARARFDCRARGLKKETEEIRTARIKRQEAALARRLE